MMQHEKLGGTGKLSLAFGVVCPVGVFRDEEIIAKSLKALETKNKCCLPCRLPVACFVPGKQIRHNAIDTPFAVRANNGLLFSWIFNIYWFAGHTSFVFCQ